MKGTLTGIVLCLMAISSLAQGTATTTLAGKVVDAMTGSPLVSASVTLQGSSAGVTTDVEGNFFLTLKRSSKNTLKVSSIGYQTKIISEIVSGKTDEALLTIALERTAGDMGNVIITASARRENTSSLYALQKNSSAISDGISAEVIKRSPDRNTSEVLRRVSGASIQDNRFVVIRGLSERYNESMLNNAVLPSTEPDRKAFAFDIIPSSLIDNITIYKSPTPDLPGDFAGGAVKISTRDFPVSSLGELTISAGFNSPTTFQNFYKGYPAGKTDWLGFFDHSRLIPGSYYQNRGAAYSNLDDNKKLAITKQFPNTYGSQAATQSHPNLGVSYTGGGTRRTGAHKFGYVYSVSYNNGRRLVDRTRDEYETYGIHDYLYHTTNYDMRSTLSGLLNLTYSYGRNKISFKNLFNNDFVSTLAIRNGTNTVNPNEPFQYKSENTEASANGIGNSVLEGLHRLADKWTIDWNASYGITYRWQPDQRILTYRTDPGTDNYFIKLNNQNSPDPTLVGRVYSFLTEHMYGASVNLTRQFEWKGRTQKLKFGSMNYYRARSVEVDALGLATTSITGKRIDEGKTTSYATLLSPSNIDSYGIIYANIPANSTDYRGTGLLNSGYIMMDNRFSEKIKLTWGLRAEKYRQELSARGKNNVALDNTDLLPSLLFTYAVNSKTNIRLAGSRTVNRPEFRELADYRVYDYENNYIIQGDPALRRSRTTNGDLRFELFPGPGEIVSLSLFYKYFNDPIEQTNLGNDVLSFANADNAKVYGTEIELRKRLSFLNSSFFDQLIVYTNASYIRGSVKYGQLTVNSPLQGQSPYLVNAGLSYSADNDNLSFNVLYNRIGQRLKFRAVTSNGAGRNIFEKSRDVLDFQVSKKFLGKKLEVKFTISDLLAQPYTWYYKYDADPSKTRYNPATDRILNTYRFGTSATAGIRYSFK